MALHLKSQMQFLNILATALFMAGCSAKGDGPLDQGQREWDGTVQVHGALRAMFHEGKTGSMVSLDSLLPNADLYAVGALADLSGEVTVVSGRIYLAFPGGEGGGAMYELPQKSDRGATLLVSATVPSWQSVVTDRAIRFEDLDLEIGRLAEESGIRLEGRFPFLLSGTFENLKWHIIDGRRLKGGGTSHEDHLKASVRASRERAAATLVGFYSTSDQGVFTHMGSNIHIHCAIDQPLSSGHVDHVDLPAGITVKFPIVKK